MNKKEFLNKYSFVFSFFLAMIAMFLMLLCVGMIGNGEYLLLRGDAFKQYMSDIHMVVRSLLNHENPMFQFSVSMGFSTVLPIALEVINPFNLLFLIFHRADFNAICIAIVLLKTGVTGMSFHIFVRKGYKTDTLWATIISIFYSMSAFAVIYGTVYYFWLDVLYILPLCALAVHLALYRKKYSFLILIFSYIFIVQFYMGFLTGIFALLYFLLLLFTNPPEKDKKSIAGSLGGFFPSSVTAILIAAIVWVPVVLFLKKYNPSDTTQFTNPQIGMLEVFNNLFWGELQSSDWCPYIYCGIPCLLLFPFYFLNKKIQIREKITYGFLLLFYVGGCFITPIYRLLHGFDAPDSYNYRFSFMISFLLCIVACRQIAYIREIKKEYLLLWVTGLMLFYALEGHLQRKEIGFLSTNNNINFATNLLFILLWIAGVVLWIKKPKIRNWVTALLIVLVLSETVSNSVYCIQAHGVLDRSGVLKSDYEEWKSEYSAVLESINEEEIDNTDFYRMSAYGDLIHNSDSYWGYNGISDFCTGEDESLRHLMDHLGLYTSKALTFATGMTPSLDMLLSVKYSIYFDQEEESEANVSVVKSDYRLPLGFMAETSSIEEIPMGMNAFENQNALFRSLSHVDDLYERVDDEKIQIVEDGLAVSADGKTLQQEKQDGLMVFIVQNETDSVFFQLEQEKELTDGLYYYPVDNMACPTDTFASFPYIAKMNRREDGVWFVSLWTDDSFAGSKTIEGVNIYRLNEDKLDEIYKILSEDTLEVTEWKNGYISGKINVTDNNKVLLTTIPVADGWTVWVDGNETEIIPAVNNTFISVFLTENGQHEIKFKYETPGFKAGLLISGIGLLLLAGVIFLDVNRNKKKVEKTAEEQ